MVAASHLDIPTFWPVSYLVEYVGAIRERAPCGTNLRQHALSGDLSRGRRQRERCQPVVAPHCQWSWRIGRDLRGAGGNDRVLLEAGRWRACLGHQSSVDKRQYFCGIFSTECGS